MHSFTESHLRREIEKAKGRIIALHLLSGTTVRGVVDTIDKDQDGFLEIVLDTENDRMRFITPVENVVAYEVAEAEQALLKLGAQTYREGALARLQDARDLELKKRWAGACYLAGRAVEAMCRSHLWQHDEQQGIGHDLRDLLKRTGYFGMTQGRDDSLLDSCNDIAVLWFNNLRFVGEDAFDRYVGSFEHHRRIKGDIAKAVTRKFVNDCEAIVSRGDLKWKPLKRN